MLLEKFGDLLLAKKFSKMLNRKRMRGSQERNDLVNQLMGVLNIHPQYINNRENLASYQNLQIQLQQRNQPPVQPVQNPPQNQNQVQVNQPVVQQQNIQPVVQQNTVHDVDQAINNFAFLIFG